MAILANYLVISNAAFELQAEQQRTFTFELPGSLVTELNTAQPLLAYKLQPLALQCDDARATLVIDMNHHRLVSFQVEQTGLHGLWETFPGYILHADTTNTVQFRLLNGVVRLADVVLWFQRYG